MSSENKLGLLDRLATPSSPNSLNPLQFSPLFLNLVGCWGVDEGENRYRYDRRHLRYESDLTKVEWKEVGPLIPPAKRGGNRYAVDIRQVTNGVMYILSTGCQWRRDSRRTCPPRYTVHEYLVRWTHDGTLERLHHALYAKCREQAAREARNPTAAIIDAQSVKSAEKGGVSIDPHGYDAGKKVKGKKRHVLVDTQGFVLHAIVTAADIQDRSSGAVLLATANKDVPVPAEALCRQRLSEAGFAAGSA